MSGEIKKTTETTLYCLALPRGKAGEGLANIVSIHDIHDRLTNQVAANLKLVNSIHDLTVQDVVVPMYTNMYLQHNRCSIVLTVYSMYLIPQTCPPSLPFA